MRAWKPKNTSFLLSLDIIDEIDKKPEGEPEKDNSVNSVNSVARDQKTIISHLAQPDHPAPPAKNNPSFEEPEAEEWVSPFPYSCRDCIHSTAGCKRPERIEHGLQCRHDCTHFQGTVGKGGTTMNTSSISWTDYSGGDANFVLRGKKRGDCEVSPGCQNCYAFQMWQRNPDKAPDQTTFNEAKLHRLIRCKLNENGTPYRRGPGSKPMVFVVDMGDLFHPNVPDDFIKHAITAMGTRTDIDFQILTKRPERMATLLSEVPDNVWIGATLENQAAADQRLPHLLRVQAKVRFLTVEPMLEPMTLALDGIDWVICGGESGPNRRPFDKEWASHLRARCKMSGVPFFFKQGAGRYPGMDDQLEGMTLKEWPHL